MSLPVPVAGPGFGPRRLAQLLAPDAPDPVHAADALPDVLTSIMRDVGIPNGIAAVGYREGDIPDLVDGALKQQRLLTTCPRPVTADDLAGIFRRSLTLW